MNIHNSKTLILLAAGLSLTSFAKAQIKTNESAPPPPSMAGLPGANRYGTDPLHLLQTVKVKQELKITDDQSDKLSKVADKYDKEAASKLAEASGAKEIRETGDKLIESSRQEVSSILNADQLNRLKQILLQVNGADALQDKEVAKQVGITPEEAAKIQKLQAQTNKSLRSNLGTAHNGANQSSAPLGDQSVKAADKIDTRAQEQSLSTLTPEQKQKFQQLAGAPFTLERSDVVGQ
jgi:Spy/CpxP family protein refolding chaperone